MIRTSPRSSAHPSGRCGRRMRRIGPCKVDTISHQPLVRKGEPWLFVMCDASCASRDAIVMVHEVIKYWKFIYTLKIVIHIIFGKQGSFFIYYASYFASIRFIIPYHQSWSMHYSHHDISVVPCKIISISNVIHVNYNLIYWQGYLALFLEAGTIAILFLFYLLPC
jgi:hypothetical protein